MIKITFQTSEDYMYEAIIVTKDNEEIFKIATSSESPEDNSLGRMGVLANLESLIKKMGGESEVIQETI